MVDDSDAPLNVSQQRLLAVMSHGRHPRSIPRQSKLWHLIHASNERLQHVCNGQPIDAFLPAEDDNKILNKSPGNPSSLESLSLAVPGEKQAQTTGPAAVLDQLNVEFKHNLPLHFGMTVVITTTAHEVLVMTEDDQLVVKSVSDVEPSDQFTFQVINMANTVDSRPVRFGDALWIKLPASRKKTWDNTAILAAKLECPPMVNHLTRSISSPRRAAAVASSSAENGAATTSSPAICGSPVPLPITIPRTAEEAERGDHVNRQKQRHATEVGQWVVQSATVAQAKAGHTVLAHDVVYLEQNLYCIASSQGASPMSDFAASRASPTTLARQHVRNREQLLQKSLNGEGIGTPACLRSVVLKDGDQYDYRLDRRCLWHIRVIESQETLKSLPKGEVKAHRLLRLAKRKLRQSQRYRSGAVVYCDTSINGRPLSSGANFSREFRQAMASSRARLESESVRAQSASGRIQQLSRSRCNSADPRLERRLVSSGGWSDERPRDVSLSLDKLENAENEQSDVQSCRVCAMMRHSETKYHLCSIHRNAQSIALKTCDRTRITEYPVTPPVHQQRRDSATTTSLGLRGSQSAGGMGIYGKPRAQKLGVAVPCYTTDDILCKFQREDENLIKILRYEARAMNAKRLFSLFDDYVPKLSIDETLSQPS